MCADVSGVGIEVKITGDRQPLVLLHGFLDSERPDVIRFRG